METAANEARTGEDLASTSKEGQGYYDDEGDHGEGGFDESGEDLASTSKEGQGYYDDKGNEAEE